MIIRRVGPLSCAKIAGIIYAVLGLVLGAAVSMFAMIGAALSSTQRPETALTPILGVVFGVGAIVMLPLFYGVIGSLSWPIGAWRYNLIAAKLGGIEIDVEQI